MNFTPHYLSYGSTGYFSKIVTAYLAQADELKGFYSFAPTVEGIREAIRARKTFPTNRALLVNELNKQYAGIDLSPAQQYNIQQLNNENCFTITTAHQPNIFTGHLYFIYKILHAVKLAESLKALMPENDFVPVYYMGSEDADLDELGEVTVNGTTHHWKTNQSGAVGRMKADDELLKILDLIAGQISVEPHGNEIISLAKQCYVKGSTIEQSTFKLVNALFAELGLIILLPDNALYKQAMAAVFEDELLNHTSAKIVEATSAELGKHFKVQAYPREINLFYLSDDKRVRIEQKEDKWVLAGEATSFSKDELLLELKDHPERFSPNVILRGLFQETILPNIAFIGGGGELAYWLQLKDLFVHYKTPYPVQVLRNSFLVMEKNMSALLPKLGIGLYDVFQNETLLLNELVKRESSLQLSLANEKASLEAFYTKLKTTAGAVDHTLAAHTGNLYAQALKKINALEKKMLRKEKLKFEAQQRQLHKLKSQLFPKGSLQERVDNFMPYYAKWGKEFISALYEHSKSMEMEFGVLVES